MNWKCFPDYRPMPALESLRLSPFAKWRKYGRVPWKFIINIIMALLATGQVYTAVQILAPHSRAQLSNWNALLSPKSGNYSTEYVGTKPVYMIYDVGSFLASVRHISETYYNIEDTSVDQLEYGRTDAGEIVPIQMVITSYASGSQIFNPSTDYDGTLEQHQYSITPSDLGPLNTDQTSLRKLILSFERIMLKFDIMSYDLREAGRTCLQWSVHSHYDFSKPGRTELTIGITYRFCDKEIEKFWIQRPVAGHVLLCLAILAIASLSQILHFKAIYRSFREYRRARRVYDRTRSGSNATHSRAVSWSQLSFSQKRKFYNFWFFNASVSNICNFIGALVCIHNEVTIAGSLTAARLLTGLGAMLAWTTLVQYFEHSSSYYVLILTLKRGIPRVLKFASTASIIFVGFCLFGLQLFSDYSVNFATFDATAVTLFSLVNGDAVHSTFEELYPFYPVISRVYLYVFICLFIYAVLNIFIVIIEDAFTSCKEIAKLKASPDMDLLELLELPAEYSEQAYLEIEASRSCEHQLATESTRKRSSSLKEPLLQKNSLSQSPPSKPSPLSAMHLFDNARSRLLNDIDKEIFKLSSQLSPSDIRPPHDETYFPCEFNDCLQCAVQHAAKNALATFRRDLLSCYKSDDFVNKR